MLFGLLALPVALVAGVTFHDLVRRPTLRRLAFRNANRRRGEALLVLVGSMLGTAIICASLIAGDSLQASIRDFARTQLGPVDETLDVGRAARLGPVADALRADGPIPGTDGGPLPVLRAGATVSTGTGATARAEPVASLTELDFGPAAAFGGDRSATGLEHAGPTPRGNEAVLSAPLASELHAGPGTRIRVFAYGEALELTVRQVVPELGLAGFWTGDGRARNVFVAPGTLAGMLAGSTAGPAGGPAAAGGAAGPTGRSSPPSALLLVSNTGGVFSGARRSEAVRAELSRRLSTRGITGVEVDTRKADLLRHADAGGQSFRRLFSGMGAFSVIAGILLLVNIFVMLAEERKRELGMLRALGMGRRQLVRAFGMEGVLYAVVASLLGALAGLGLGRAIVWVAAGIFRSGSGGPHGEGLDLRFATRPATIATGTAIGLAIALVTVWGTSLRIGRLNVIRAIRDLPEPERSGRRRRRGLLGGAGVALGSLMLATGVAGRAWFPALVGPVVAAWSAYLLFGTTARSRRVAASVCGLAVIGWGTSCFRLFPDVFHDFDVAGFVVQGVVLVTSAVVVVTFNDEVFVRIAGRLSGSGRALAARLGMAYPLARRFRTGMTLAMYALVIFTLTFITIFSRLFAGQAPRLADQTRAGYDVVVDSNPADPASASLLAAQPGVTGVAPLLRTAPRFSSDAHPQPDRWPLSGFDAAFLARGVPHLSRRDPSFPNDRAAWEQVLRGDDLAIVPSFFLQGGGGPPRSHLVPGGHITGYGRDGKAHRFTVAGIMGSDWLFNGVMANTRAVSSIAPEAAASRAYVALRPGIDPRAFSTQLDGRLLSHGVDAHGIRQQVTDSLHQQQGFIRLIEGFLALGLVVGIAGLGVIMVRAVRERRRQIGMLRAMGFSRGVVRAAFLSEATFIATQGVVIGAALAIVTSYELLTSSKSFGNQHLAFGVPWLELTALLLTALGASVVFTLAPAIQASRVLPAVALRME
ncbi:MAG: ABC transporter permease [Acidimicrobiales bacterium]